ncbi:MAG: addiction module protein [Pirellulales bacterium]|nr:addiction module protein [Pirellulales bacterium]
MQLPDEQRAHIAVSLIDSLDKQRESAWDAEIARRVTELDEGTVTPVPWAETRDRLKSKLDELPKS